MSSISAIRFVNVNYGEKNTINDKTFALNGESTLFSMENGMGKTVMIQLIMSVFADNKKHRDLQDRRYIDFFRNNSGRPTTIMVEMQKDEGNERVIAGITGQLRKGDTDEEDGLRLYTFVGSYKNPNVEYSIRNIGFVDSNDNKKIFKTFEESKSMLKHFKEKFPSRFHTYSIPNYQKQYIEELNSLGIDTDVWNDVIYKINSNGESGLSKLFEKDKTSQDLIKNWFIPACKQKNSDADKNISNMQQHLISAFKTKLKLRDCDIQHKNLIKLSESLSEYKTLAENFNDVADKEYEILKEYKSFYVSLKTTKQNLVKRNEEKDTELNNLENEAKNFSYCIKSIEYNKSFEKLESTKIEMTNEENREESLEDKIKSLDTKKDIITLNGIYSEIVRNQNSYEVAKKQYNEQTNRLSNKNIQDEIKMRQQEIRFLLEKKIDELSKQLDRLNNERNCSNRNKEALKNQQENISDEIEKLIAKKSELITRKENYLNECNEFVEKYKYNRFVSVTNEIMSDKLNALKATIYNKVTDLNDQKTNIKENISINEEEIKSTEVEINEALTKQKDINSTIEMYRTDLKKCQELISRRREILTYCSIAPNKYLYNGEFIIEKLKAKLAEIRNSIFACEYDIKQRDIKINGLKNKRIFKLDDKVTEILNENGIDFQYGYKVALNSDFDNELLPYSIVVLNESDLELARQLLHDNNVHTDNVIPIIARIELTNKFDSEDHLLYQFDKKLLTDEGVKNYIANFDEKNVIDKNKLKQLRENELELEDFIKQIRTDNLDCDTEVVIKNHIKQFEEDFDNLISKTNQLKRKKEDIENEKKQLIEQEKEVDIKIVKANNEEHDFERIYKGVVNYTKDFNDLSDTLGTIKNKREQKQNIEEQINNEDKHIQQFRNEISDLKYVRTLQNDKLSKYKNFSIDSDFSTAKTFDDLPRLLEEDEKWFNENKSIEALRNEMQKYKQNVETNKTKLNSHNVNNIPEEVYKSNITYTILEISIERKQCEALKSNCHKKVLELTNKHAKLETEVERLKNDIVEEFDKQPLLNSEIQQLDYKQLRLNVTEKIDSIKTEINNNQNVLNFYKETLLRKEESINNLEYIYDIDEQNIVDLSIFSKTQIKKKFSNIEDKMNKLQIACGKVKANEKALFNRLSSKLDRNYESSLLELHLKYENINADNKSGNRSLAREIDNQTKAKQQTVERFIKNLKNKMKEYDRTFNEVFKLTVETIHDIDEELDIIGKGFSIEVGGKRKVLIKIDKYKWDDEADILKRNIEDYLNNSIEQAIQIEADHSNNKSAEVFLEEQISIEKIYQEALKLDEIKVTVAKVGNDRKYTKMLWDEVSISSGSERFNASFIVISILMDYSLSKSNVQGIRNKASKVLLMDNPFATTYSLHSTELLQKLSKKLNIQLVCYSGIDQENIYNMFDNMYVLSLHSNYYNDTKTLYSVHQKGEEYDTVISSKFKVKQSSLF